MNELSPLRGPLFASAAASSAIELPLTTGLGIHVYSNPRDKIMIAVGQVQWALENPVVDKEATVVSKRTNSRYTFRYAKLGSILEMMRPHLKAAGLIYQAHRLEHGFVLYRLEHVDSGQFVQNAVQIWPEDPKSATSVQSEITYHRRTTALHLLGLANDDDDDDAVEAGGHRASFRQRGPDGDWRAGRDVAHPPAEETPPDPNADLLARAADARSLVDGGELLKCWLVHRPRVTAMRQRDPEGWTAIIDQVARGLQGSIGRDVAAVWKGFAKASTPEHEKSLRAKVDTDWAMALAEFAAACSWGHGALMQHMHACYEVIMADARKAQAEAAAAASAVAQHLAAQPAPAQPAPAQADPGQPPPVDRAVGFAQHVRDWCGDLAGDLLTDARVWALQYETLWLRAGDEERLQLTEHNEEALAYAKQHEAARAILDDLDNEGRPGVDGEEGVINELARTLDEDVARVDMPLGRNGQPSMADYVAAIRTSLANSVHSPADMKVWQRANGPVYNGGGVTLGTIAKIAAAVLARKQEIGDTDYESAYG
jgi:hypothetical protein